MELKMFSNHFFENFSNSIKKNNWLIWFRRIKCGLVRLGDNNCCRDFEIRQLMTQLYTDVSDINEFANAVVISDNRLDMALC